MKKLRLLGLFFGLALIGPNAVWSQTLSDTEGDGFVVTLDARPLIPATCLGMEEDRALYLVKMCKFGRRLRTCRRQSACSIPLDGGLSLLALAGGGLATAAMRRRREEEEAAAQRAA